MIKRGFKVTFVWVPSHVGIAGIMRGLGKPTSALPAEPEDRQIENRTHLSHLTFLYVLFAGASFQFYLGGATQQKKVSIRRFFHYA